MLLLLILATQAVGAEPLTRVLDLDGEWTLHQGTQSRGVAVPGIYRSRETDVCLIFERDVTLPQAWRAGQDRLILELGRVDYSARVFLDGHLLGTCEGYCGPVRLDATRTLRRQPSARLRIEVRDVWEDREKPRRTVQGVDNIVWGTNFSGLNESVRLIRTPGPCITGMIPMGGAARPRLRVRVHNYGAAGPARLQALATPDGFAGGTLKGAVEVRLVPGVNRLEVPLTGPARAWSPERPGLYRLRLSVSTKQGLACQSTYPLGLRSVRLHEGRFELDGRARFLGAVDLYGELQASHFKTAEENYQTDRRWARDNCSRAVRFLKEVGLDMVRVPHNLQPDYFYGACDRGGLLVYQDFPLIWGYDLEVLDAGRVEKMFEELLWRIGCHPSVVVVSCTNEYAGKPEDKAAALVGRLIRRTREVDPERLVVGNSGGLGRAFWPPAMTSPAVADDWLDVHRYWRPDEGLDSMVRQFESWESNWLRMKEVRPAFLSECQAPAALRALFVQPSQLSQRIRAPLPRDLGGGTLLESLRKLWSERRKGQKPGTDAELMEVLRESLLGDSAAAPAATLGELGGEWLARLTLETRIRWGRPFCGLAFWSLCPVVEIPGEAGWRTYTWPPPTSGLEPLRRALAPVAVYARTQGDTIRAWVVSEEAVQGEVALEVAGARAWSAPVRVGEQGVLPLKIPAAALRPGRVHRLVLYRDGKLLAEFRFLAGRPEL
ncbi:MAG: hypothetical protein HY319_10935 [Armatimonadetes bacterium]|nr:hypothetical protein [Armatimonadota bacterium]